MTNRVIISNKAQCRLCGDIIESTHRHMLQRCSCKSITVDGGQDYLRRLFKNIEDIIELSEIEHVKGEDEEI